MTEQERADKAAVIIKYICEIFREESLDGSAKNPNFELFLSLLECRRLIVGKNSGVSREIAKTLSQTYFKNLIKVEKVGVAAPALKLFNVNQITQSLIDNQQLNDYVASFVAENDLNFLQFVNEVYNVGNQYLSMLEKLFRAKFITGKQELFNKLNTQLQGTSALEKNKKSAN